MAHRETFNLDAIIGRRLQLPHAVKCLERVPVRTVVRGSEYVTIVPVKVR